MPYRRIFVFIVAALLSLVFVFIMTGYAALNQAETAWQAQDYQTAAAQYARAARVLIWRDDLLEKAGLAAYRQGDYQTAIRHLERAKLSPQSQLALAYCYYQIGDMTGAQAAFENGAALYRTPEFYKGLAFLYRSQKKWDAERRALENQLEQDVGDAYAHYRLGVLLTALDSQSALSELMLAASLNPEVDPAVQTLRAALSLSATQPDASMQMVTVGRALGLVHEWELAAVAFGKAVEVDSKNPEAWAWLGEARQQTGSDGRAELERALALDPTSPVLRGLRGLYWDRQQKYPQALSEYLQAAAYEPQNPAWQASIGDAYFKSGDLISALAAYQRATELAPDEAEYWRLLAVFCADNGVQVEDIGLPAAKKAAQLASNDPLTLDTLGWSYLASNRYANAEQTLLDVVARFPAYYPAHIHLALTYLAQGNYAAAFPELNHVRNADAGGEHGMMAERLLKKYFP